MLREGPELRWVVSTGGPLLLVPGEHLPSWGGVLPPTDGRRIEAQFRFNGQDEPATDYDRACDVSMAGYLGQLDIGTGHGIVLGDEPLATAWQPAAAASNGDDDMGGLLIRCVYANSYADVIEALEHVPQTAWQDEGLVLSVGHEPVYLLDAASPASELAGDDHMTIQVPPGRYALATAQYEPDVHTCLLLHRLTRMSSVAAGL
jgi:hypothetical protein